MKTLNQRNDTNGQTGMIVKRVSVPIGLEELMEGLSKEVILKKPKDLYIFASEYFTKLVNLREKSNKYKAHPVHTIQSVTKLRNVDVPPIKKIAPARPTKHLSRQLSIHSKSPSQQRPPQTESITKIIVSSKSRERKTSTDRKDSIAKSIPKPVLSRDLSKSTKTTGGTSTGTSSVQSTPRDKRQSSMTRTVKSSDNQNKAREENKKTPTVPKRSKSEKVKTALISPTVIGGTVAANTAVVVADKDANILGENTKISSISNEIKNIDIQPSDNKHVEKMESSEKSLDSDILALSTNVAEVSKHIYHGEEELEKKKDGPLDETKVDRIDKPDDKKRENENRQGEISNINNATESLDITNQNSGHSDDQNGSDVILSSAESRTNVSVKDVSEIDNIQESEKMSKTAMDLVQSIQSETDVSDSTNKSRLDAENVHGILENSIEQTSKPILDEEGQDLKLGAGENQISIEEKLGINDITIKEKDEHTLEDIKDNTEHERNANSTIKMSKDGPNTIYTNNLGVKDDSNSLERAEKINANENTLNNYTDKDNNTKYEEIMEDGEVGKKYIENSYDNKRIEEPEPNASENKDIIFDNSKLGTPKTSVTSLVASTVSENDSTVTSRIQSSNTEEQVTSQKGQDRLSQIDTKEKRINHGEKTFEAVAPETLGDQTSDLSTKKEQNNSNDAGKLMQKKDAEENISISVASEQDKNVVDAHAPNNNEQSTSVKITDSPTKESMDNRVTIKMERMGQSDDLLTVSIPDNIDTDSMNKKHYETNSKENDEVQTSESTENAYKTSTKDDVKPEGNQFFRKNEELVFKESDKIKIKDLDGTAKDEEQNDPSIKSVVMDASHENVINNSSQEDAVKTEFAKDLNSQEDTSPKNISSFNAHSDNKILEGTNNNVTQHIINYEISKKQPGVIDSPVKHFLNSFINNEQLNVFKSKEEQEKFDHLENEIKIEESVNHNEKKENEPPRENTKNSQSNENSNDALPTENMKVYAESPLTFSSVKDLLDFDPNNVNSLANVKTTKKNYITEDTENTQKIEPEIKSNDALENIFELNNSLTKDNETQLAREKRSATEGEAPLESNTEASSTAVISNLNETRSINDPKKIEENANNETLKMVDPENAQPGDQPKTQTEKVEKHDINSTTLEEENMIDTKSDENFSDIIKPENESATSIKNLDNVKDEVTQIGKNQVTECITNLESPNYTTEMPDEKEITLDQIDNKIIELKPVQESFSKSEILPSNDSPTKDGSSIPRELEEKISATDVNAERQTKKDNVVNTEIPENDVKIAGYPTHIQDEKGNKLETKKGASEEISSKMNTEDTLIGTDKKENFQKNGEAKITEIADIVSAIDIIQKIMSSKISVQKPGEIDASVSQYLNSFLSNEQSNVYKTTNGIKSAKLENQRIIPHKTSTLDKTSARNKSFESKVVRTKAEKPLLSKKERSRSQENVLSMERKLSETTTKNSKMRRVRSVGIIKPVETDHKNKIPTSARRSAGRRPLIRQLETDSKDIEEKLNNKKEVSKIDKNFSPKSSEDGNKIVLQNSKETEADKVKNEQHKLINEPLVERYANKIVSENNFTNEDIPDQEDQHLEEAEAGKIINGEHQKDIKSPQKEKDKNKIASTDVVTKEDVLIAKTILKGIQGAEKHIELIEEKIVSNEKNQSKAEVNNDNKNEKKQVSEVNADKDVISKDIDSKNKVSIHSEKETISDADRIKSEIHKTVPEKILQLNESTSHGDPKEFLSENTIERRDVAGEMVESVTDIGDKSRDIRSKTDDGNTNNEHHSNLVLDQVETVLRNTHKDHPVNITKDDDTTKPFQEHSDKKLIENMEVAGETIGSFSDSSNILEDIKGTGEVDSVNGKKESISPKDSKERLHENLVGITDMLENTVDSVADRGDISDDSKSKHNADNANIEKDSSGFDRVEPVLDKTYENQQEHLIKSHEFQTNKDSKELLNENIVEKMNEEDKTLESVKQNNDISGDIKSKSDVDNVNDKKENISDFAEVKSTTKTAYETRLGSLTKSNESATIKDSIERIDENTDGKMDLANKTKENITDGGDMLGDLKKKTDVFSLNNEKDSVSDFDQVEFITPKTLEPHPEKGNESDTPKNSEEHLYESPAEKTEVIDKSEENVTDKGNISEDSKSKSDNTYGAKESNLDANQVESQTKNIDANQPEIITKDKSELPNDSKEHGHLEENTGVVGETTESVIVGGNISGDNKDKSDIDDVHGKKERILEINQGDHITNNIHETQETNLIQSNEPKISKFSKELSHEKGFGKDFVGETIESFIGRDDLSGDIKSQSDIDSVNSKKGSMFGLVQHESVSNETHENQPEIIKNDDNPEISTSKITLENFSEKTDMEGKTVDTDSDKGIMINDNDKLVVNNPSLKKQEDITTDSKTSLVSKDSPGNSEAKQTKGIIISALENDYDLKSAPSLESKDMSAKDSLGFIEDTSKDKADNAATKIQKTWRGFNLRKNLDPKIKDVDDGSKNYENQEEKKANQNLRKERNAAVKIQSLWRGYVTRKLWDNDKKRGKLQLKPEEAIIKIQAIVRGYLERIQYNKLKASYTAVTHETDNLSKNDINFDQNSNQKKESLNDQNNDTHLEQSLSEQKVIDNNLETPSNETENKEIIEPIDNIIGKDNLTDNEYSASTEKITSNKKGEEEPSNSTDGKKENRIKELEDNLKEQGVIQTLRENSNEFIKGNILPDEETDTNENCLTNLEVKKENKEKNIIGHEEFDHNKTEKGQNDSKYSDISLSKSIIQEKFISQGDNTGDNIKDNTSDQEFIGKINDNKNVSNYSSDKKIDENVKYTSGENIEDNNILGENLGDNVKNLDSGSDNNFKRPETSEEKNEVTLNDNKNVADDKQIGKVVTDADGDEILTTEIEKNLSKAEIKENLSNQIKNVNNDLDTVATEYDATIKNKEKEITNDENISDQDTKSIASENSNIDNHTDEEQIPVSTANLEDINGLKRNDPKQDSNIQEEAEKLHNVSDEKVLIKNSNENLSAKIFLDENINSKSDIKENYKNEKIIESQAGTTLIDKGLLTTNSVVDPNVENNSANSDFKETKVIEKPDFYRSDTVLEPAIVKKVVSSLGDDSKNSSQETHPINENIELNEKDDNNNTPSKEETELESEIRSTIDKIINDDKKNKSPLEFEIKSAVKDIMENNVGKSDGTGKENDDKNEKETVNENEVLDMFPSVPSHAVPEHMSEDVDITDHTIKNVDEHGIQNVLSSKIDGQLDESTNDLRQADTLDKSKGDLSNSNILNQKDEIIDQSTKNNIDLVSSASSEKVDNSSEKDLKNNKELCSSEIPADDVSSVDSVDSIITVIPNVNYDASIKPEHGSSDQNILPTRSLSQDIIKGKENKEELNKNLVKKSLSTDALKGHVDLIDQVQNTLLDQISGKPVNTASKFDIEQLRKELHEAASLYKSEEDNSHFETHDDELLEYLNDFEPEDENNYDSKNIRTPIRELPDIEEEVDSSNDDHETMRKSTSNDKTSQFCKTLSHSSTGTEKLIDNKPLKDHVEILNPDKLKQGHNEIIINNDNIQINRSENNDASLIPVEDSNQQLLHTSELHDMVIPMGTSSSNRNALVSSGKLKHTSEFHDTLVVPLPSGSDVNIKNEAKEMFPKDKPEEPTKIESVDTGNQTAIQQSPAGAPIVTSRRSSQDGVAVAEAQASLRDTSPAKPKSVESFTLQSPPQSPRFVQQAMESEHNNNKRNNAIKNNISAPGKNMEAEAATKIQAGFRGYQVRKQLKSKNSATDKSNQERHSVRRKTSGRKNTKDSELAEKSAVKIQAGVRGFLVRRRQKKQLSSSASA